jgi:hypothetical protein
MELPLQEMTSQLLPLVSGVYREIATSDRGHNLEGWLEAGNVMQMIELGGVLVPEHRLTP